MKLAAMLMTVMLAQTSLDASPATAGKYIVAFGGLPASAGGSPTPRNLVDQAELIRSLPVDGVMFNLTNLEGYFADTIFAQPAPAFEKLQPEIEAYRSLHRGSGANNHDFLRLNTSALNADWYDDAAWSVFVENVRAAGRAMAAMGVRGVFLDTEAYAGTPFCFKVQARRTEHDFSEYCRQVRERGRQLGAALAESVPYFVMLLTFGPESGHRRDGASNLAENAMGLVPAFICGFQEVAPRARIMDGYESAYTYRSYRQFSEAQGWMTSARANSFPGHDGKPPVRAGFGIWLRRTGEGEGKLDGQDFTKNSHTPEEWEHALHYALLLADEYVWVYSVPWATLPGAYRQTFAAARKPHVLDFHPLVRQAENKPAAYIISAKGRADVVNATVFAPLHRTHEELFDFPKTWKFRLDPHDAGEKERWFRVGLDTTGWRDLRIDDWWEPQLNQTHLGAAWYRVEFTPPSAWKGRMLLLAFGAVDEDAYVWLNGQPLGTHAYGADGWNTPFEFPLGEDLRWDQANLLAVRVVSKAGVGGIWKSVKIFAAKEQPK